MPERYPSLFVGHGAPTLALDDNPTTRFFSSWARPFGAPRAVVVLSAHWVTSELRVTAWQRHPILHDFSGFDRALYELDYPAAGSPELAGTLAGRLEAGLGESVTLDARRGLDHGAWVPLRFMLPEADVPVLQVSLPSWWDAGRIYEIGRTLAPLRDDGVLLMGSGGAVHNLMGVDYGREPAAWDSEAVPVWARVFEEWLRENLERWNTEDLFDMWRMAPHGVQSHPSEEHLQPLFYAMGAGDEARRASVVHDGYMHGSLSMLAVQFD